MNTTSDQQNTDREAPKRIKVIAWLNFFFAVLLFAHSYNASRQGYYWQGVIFFISFVSLGLGGYYLLERRRIGKSLTRLSGFLGLLLLVYFSCRYTPYFFDSRYPFASVFDSVQHTFFLYFLRTFYPIIAAFLLLNKTNDELGLE